MNTVRAIDSELLELQNLTDPDRPITYGVVKPGPEDPSTGVVFIRGGDISNGSINEEHLRTITQQVSRPYARTILRGGEVVISLVGNPGEVAIVPDRLAGANLARQAGLIALRPEIDAAYIKYYLMSPPGLAELFQRTQGAVQQVINLSDLKRVKVRLPSRQVQEGIVSILSAYDDLIENNRRRITLLEEAARLLYREWFVHFRFPGHEHVKITNGLPEGWGRLPASEAFEVSPKTSRNDDGNITYVPMGALSETGMVVGRGELEVREKPTSVRFRNGDTLFARITPCLENGKTGFVQLLAPDEVACGSTELIVLRGRHVSNYFAYLTAREPDFRENAIKSMIGSSGRQRVQPSCFDRYGVPVPSDLMAKLFDEAVGPMFEQISRLDQQNQKLAQARDLLLPRLMNGEIAV